MITLDANPRSIKLTSCSCIFVLGCTCCWDFKAHSLQEVAKRYAYLIFDDDFMMMLSMMERGSCKNTHDFEVDIVDWKMTLFPCEDKKKLVVRGSSMT